MAKEPTNPSARTAGLGTVLALGSQLAASFLMPIAVGIWLDGRWGSTPACLLLGLVLGLGLGGLALRNVVRALERRGDGR